MMRRSIAVVSLLLIVGCEAGREAPLQESPVEAARLERCVETRDSYSALAESGDPTASFEMAELYDVGCAVPHDPFKAYLGYRTAAEGGHGKAAMRLGYFYSGGKGIAADWDDALFWFAVADRTAELSPLERRWMEFQRSVLARRLIARDQGSRFSDAEARAEAWKPRTD